MANLGFERRYLINELGRWVWFLRSQPAHAAHYLAGIALPPHERVWLTMSFANYKENNIVASRGTSKSFTFVSLAAPLRATLYKNKGLVVLSASGFRGGKLLMDDTERLFKGRLRSQRPIGPFLEKVAMSPKIIRREADRWKLETKANSMVTTVPTNNFQNLRGIRATDIFIDERNTFPGEMAQKVVRPMLNVGGEFRKTAVGGDTNKMFQISTIDYTVRDWYPEIEATRKLARMEYEAQMALRRGDHLEYDRLMNEDEGALKDASVYYSRVDYTDLLIPQRVRAKYLDDEIYEVHYPVDADTNINEVVRYDRREDISYIYTYPVDKKGLEEPLINGTMDSELWLAEQRNVFIAAAGTFFTHSLIQKVAERPIYEAGEIPGFKDVDEEFYAPVMYRCGDPCVLGIDYARDSDHFGIVVVRLGELADQPFDPFMLTADSKKRPYLGKTPWNNIIWAESWERWTAQEAQVRILEMMERYNVIYSFNMDEIVPGIGMDKGGGGSHIRDDLANPKAPIRDDGTPDPDWKVPMRIYDPNDEDYAHYSALGKPDTEYWPGLELIKPTNESNTEMAFGVRGLMEKGKLYIGYVEPPSKWAVRLGMVKKDGTYDDGHPEFRKWNVGYLGIRRMVKQLLKIQTKLTPTGKWQFEMPGDRTKEEGKKDLFSSLIYGGYVARKHLVHATKSQTEAPMVQPIAVTIGRANAGTRDPWFRRLGM